MVKLAAIGVAAFLLLTAFVEAVKAQDAASWLKARSLILNTMLVGTPEEEAGRVRKSLGLETINCISFYQIVQARFSDTSDVATIANLGEISENLLLHASYIIDDEEVLSALLDIAARSMTETVMKGDWERLPILEQKYSFDCKDLYEKPHRRILHSMKQEGVALNSMVITEDELDRLFE